MKPKNDALLLLLLGGTCLLWFGSLRGGGVLGFCYAASR